VTEDDARAAVLVEGRSDRAALLALARRQGRDLDAERVAVVAMDGATNVARHLERVGPRGLGLQVAGLCDAAEERWFRRGLERAGFGAVDSRDALEAHGFFVCEADLEDELIRALGPAGVERVIEAQGELPSLRRLRQMPAHRGRPREATLHRFMGSRGDRKIRYASLLVAALDDGRVPRPLREVLTAV
jgi:hypothetical protein